MSFSSIALPLTLTKLGMAVDGTVPIQSTTFLEQEVGFRCLASLLGVGTNRLRRSGNTAPDLRLGKDKSGSQKESFSIDAFFATLYQSVAETLPDRQGWVEKCWLRDHSIRSNFQCQ